MPKNRKAKKDANKMRLDRSWILHSGLFLAVLGLLLIIGSFWCPGLIPEEIAQQALENGSDLRGGVASVLMTVGQLLISIGITAVFFERFGYVDYAVKRLCEVLGRDEVLKVLTPERKKELKSKLFKDIYLGNVENDDSEELLDQLDRDFDTLLADYYYEEYSVFCDVYFYPLPDFPNKQLVHKHIRRIFTVKAVRPGDACTLERLFSVRTKRFDESYHDPDGRELEPVSVKSLRINGTKLAAGEFAVKNEPTDRDSNSYNVRYYVEPKDKSLLNFNDDLEVDITYETFVEMNDLQYSVIIDRPCKQLTCHFTLINTEDYELSVSGNGFMSYGNQRSKQVIKSHAGKTIRFRSWTLPGDGVTAIISPKTPETYSTQDTGNLAAAIDAGNSG